MLPLPLPPGSEGSLLLASRLPHRLLTPWTILSISPLQTVLSGGCLLFSVGTLTVTDPHLLGTHHTLVHDFHLGP